MILSFPAVKMNGWKYSTHKIVSSWPVKNDTNFMVWRLNILAFELFVITMTKSLSFFYFLLDLEYLISMISSLKPMIVSSVERVLPSTRVRFCSAETTINSLFENGNIFITPVSAVFTSLRISCFLLFKSMFKTLVYSPPKINVPFSK